MILTSKLLHKGMTKGVGINRDQAYVLGADIKRKGWLKELIDTDIPDDVYYLYISLKGLKPAARKKVLSNHGKEPVTEQQYFDALETVHRYQKERGLLKLNNGV